MVQICVCWGEEKKNKNYSHTTYLVSEGSNIYESARIFHEKYERVFHSLYNSVQKSLSSTQNLQPWVENTSHNLSHSQELVFYLTTIIHFISITPNSSHGAVINYLKEPLFSVNSLSSGPEAIIVLPFLVPFLTAAKGRGSSLSLTFLLIFREVCYLFKDDLWKPSEQSRKWKNPQNVLFHL